MYDLEFGFRGTGIRLYASVMLTVYSHLFYFILGISLV